MRNYAYLTLLALVLLALPAAAEEVLYFTNGSQMPVMSHWTKGNMTFVDLGGNGFMAFPSELIEKIDTETTIELRPSTVSSTSRGRMVASSNTGRGRSARDQRKSLPLKVQNDGIETNKSGMAVKSAGQGKGGAADRLKQYVRQSAATPAGSRQSGGVQGTRRMGNRHVMDSGQPKSRKLVGINRR